jgi:dephospho-CoA kinase
MNGGRQAELSQRLISKMTRGRDWVVEGLRHPLDYESLKKAFASSFHLVYIDSPKETRWSRLKRISRFRTFEEFDAADNHPVEQQMPALRQFAELVVNASEPLQQLYEPLDQLLVSLRRGNQ